MLAHRGHTLVKSSAQECTCSSRLIGRPARTATVVQAVSAVKPAGCGWTSYCRTYVPCWLTAMLANWKSSLTGVLLETSSIRSPAVEAGRGWPFSMFSCCCRPCSLAQGVFGHTRASCHPDRSTQAVQEVTR